MAEEPNNDTNAFVGLDDIDYDVISIIRRTDEDGMAVLEIDHGALDEDTAIAILTRAINSIVNGVGCVWCEDDDDEDEDGAGLA